MCCLLDLLLKVAVFLVATVCVSVCGECTTVAAAAGLVPFLSRCDQARKSRASLRTASKFTQLMSATFFVFYYDDLFNLISQVRTTRFRSLPLPRTLPFAMGRTVT